MPLDPFSTLGEHELAIIVEYLDPLDVIRGQLVSRLWRHYLNSEQLSKIALLHAFPQAKETLDYKKVQQRRELARLAVGDGSHDDNNLLGEDEAVDAVLSFRRCVYRMHTRKLGQPTTLLYHILESEDGSIELDHYGVEWDVAGGKALVLRRRLHVDKRGIEMGTNMTDPME